MLELESRGDGTLDLGWHDAGERRGATKSIKKLELHVTRVRLDGLGPALAEPFMRAIDTSTTAAWVARTQIGRLDQEVVIAIHLDARQRALGFHEVGRGSVVACTVSAREVFRTAIVAGAVAVILAHNHPSGDPSPSRDDSVLTERICAAGKLLGIEVLDHVIVAHDRHFSFLDAGLLDK